MKVPEPKKLPSGNYNIRLRLGGEEISITKLTSQECIQEAQVIKAEYLAGRRIKRTQKTQNLTIGEILDNYISDRESVLSPSTIAGYKTVRKNRFKNYTDKKPSQIKKWQTVINDELLDNCSEKTVANSWGLLSSALSYSGYPVPDVQLPMIASSTRPWLDANQIKVFVKAVHGHPVEIPALLLLHGMRRSEVLGLTWDKIDLKKGTIRIEGASVVNAEYKLVDKKANKTKKSRRTIPIMIPELKDALNAVPKEKRKGKVYTKTPTLIWEQVNRICEKNNLPKVGCHGLRHSMCSLAYHCGLSEVETMQIGGWSDPGTMRRIYTHLSETDKLKAENKLAAFFQNADKNADGAKKE